MQPALIIKNMVCPRCVTTVETIFAALGIPVSHVGLGEVRTARILSEQERIKVAEALAESGFELTETRVNGMVADIKRLAATYLADAKGGSKTKLSAYITAHIPYDYSYLSDLFSGIEGRSIEQYFIELRIEKVKELIVYDQLSFTEIAYLTGFSSVHHLSAQFKKVTGLTPSHFKSVGAGRRKPLDEI
jgi:hypothetical protein